MARGSVVYTAELKGANHGPGVKKMQLKAHIQDPTFCGPWERVPLEGCERDALFLLPTFFWDVSLKALPVILC